MASPPIPVYIICLAKTQAQRCDPTFSAWDLVATDHNLDVQRLTATTPDDFELADTVHPYVQKCILDNERKTTDFLGSKVEASCALSHISAWKKIAESGNPGIVVEDDMNVLPDKLNGMLDQLRTMPADTDMYLLSYLGFQFRSSPLPDGFLAVDSYVGNQAYYLTSEAAAQLVKYAFPLVFQIDTYASQSAAALGIRIRTRPENMIGWWKAFQDNILGSTLGDGHYNSTLMICIFILTGLTFAVIVAGIAWVVWGVESRRALRQCQTTV